MYFINFKTVGQMAEANFPFLDGGSVVHVERPHSRRVLALNHSVHEFASSPLVCRSLIPQSRNKLHRFSELEGLNCLLD